MPRTDRLLAITGLAYPVLTVAAFVAFPQPPGGDVSPAHDPAWLATHTTAVLAQSYLRAFGALGFLALTAVIAHRSRGLPALLASLGGGAAGALLLAAQIPVLAAALGTRQGLTPSVLRLADPLNSAILDISSLPAALLFAGTAATLFRDHAPRWLTGLSAAGLPLAALDALSYDGGPLQSIGLLGLAYFLVWALITGAWLSRAPRTNTPTASAPALT